MSRWEESKIYEVHVQVVVQLEQKCRYMRDKIQVKIFPPWTWSFKGLDDSVSQDAYILGVGGGASDPKAQ